MSTRDTTVVELLDIFVAVTPSGSGGGSAHVAFEASPENTIVSSCEGWTGHYLNPPRITEN